VATATSDVGGRNASARLARSGLCSNADNTVRVTMTVNNTNTNASFFLVIP
jgi:hypothetical protein